MTAKISLSSDNRLQIETPYNKDFVDELKRMIYYREREWVPGLKAWMVERTYLTEMEELCKRYFGAVDVNVGEKLTSLDSYRILYLTPDAPLWLVKKVYKALMQYYHPDTGNPEADEEKCKEINAAYSTIKEIPF